jgi:hypothetical protein
MRKLGALVVYLQHIAIPVDAHVLHNHAQAASSCLSSFHKLGKNTTDIDTPHEDCGQLS